MKLSSISTLSAAMLAATMFFAVPASSRADDHHHHHRSHHSSHGRDYYYSRPRSSFAVTFGTGYAGRGYYYGPSGVDYYYERPGVAYYPTRALIPHEYSYYGGSSEYRSGGLSASVQAALARRGYYHGPIDGDIGPGSRHAIARYQADHGLRPTGVINSSLLRVLGL